MSLGCCAPLVSVASLRPRFVARDPSPDLLQTQESLHTASQIHLPDHLPDHPPDLPTYLPTCLPTYQPSYQPTSSLLPPPTTYLPACLPTYLPTYLTYLPLSTYLPAYLPACLPTYQPSYKPASSNHLPSCLPRAYLPTYLPACPPPASYLLPMHELGLLRAPCFVDRVVVARDPLPDPQTSSKPRNRYIRPPRSTSLTSPDLLPRPPPDPGIATYCLPDPPP